MPDRDLDITKFSYYAYRKLKKTLGEFDAVIECNEIAIKEFVEQAPKEKLQQYVQQLSQKHKVKVDEVDFLKFTSRIRQYYISSVFQQAEQFRKDFKIEQTQYFFDKTWTEPLKGETKLQNTLRNISLTLPSDLIDVYEYYRLVRNYMSHTDRDLEELKIRHVKIQSNTNDFLNELHLSSVKDIKERKATIVTIDPSLDKLREQNLFPEKLAKANEMLKTAKLPTKKHSS